MSSLTAASCAWSFRRRRSSCKPWDEVVIFKALVLQALYNLSDDQAEYQLRDLSFMRFFMRFLGLELEDAVPDAKTLWLYREALAKRKNPGTVELLGFLQALRDRRYSPDKTLRGTKDWIDIAQVTLFKGSGCRQDDAGQLRLVEAKGLERSCQQTLMHC